MTIRFWRKTAAAFMIVSLAGGILDLPGEQLLRVNAEEMDVAGTTESSEEVETSSVGTVSSTGSTDSTSSSTTTTSATPTESSNLNETATSSTKKTTSSSTMERMAEVARLPAAPFSAPFSLGTGNPDVPKGAILLEGVFGALNSDAGSSSSSSGVTTIHDANVNNGVPYSEVSLSGQKSWLSLWSNKNYRLDFNKSFHGRTYMNFGGEVDSDGLAFVMQNQGETALTTANGGSDGQNLGVYGYSDVGLLLTTPEKAAIKKSVAIEFDLHTNKGGYDMDNQETPHMVYSFPGNLDKGYRSTGILGGWVPGATAVVRHNASTKLNGVIGDNIRDNTWYEFRYDFDVTTKTFSYYMKNPVTNAQTAPVTIPWADLSSQLALSSNQNKAYWGFTAANGDAPGKVKFVFTQVPVDLSAKIENDVASEGKSVVDSNDGSTSDPNVPVAADNKSITFSSTFSVDPSSEAGLIVGEWKSYLNSKDIDLTKGVKFASAKIGEITYSGIATLDTSTGDVAVIFPKLTVLPGQSVTLSYVAEPIKHDATTKSYFSSNITTKEVGNGTAGSFLGESVAYWINGNKAPELTNFRVSQPTFTDFIDRPTYLFSYADADSDELTANIWLNGKLILADKKFTSTPAAAEFLKQDNKVIDLLDTATNYLRGENALKVSLSDGINPTITQELKFNVEGYYGFEELTDNFAWKYARSQLNSKDTAMARVDSMKIKIRDTRTATVAPDVKVEFTATSTNNALTTNRFSFDKQDVSALEFPVNQEMIYGKDQGLLLKLNDAQGALVADGKLTWSIVNAP